MIDPSPGVALTPVGALDTVAGVAAAEAAETELVPAALVAVTVKVYWSPLVRPVTVQLVADVTQVEPSPSVPGLVRSVAVTV